MVGLIIGLVVLVVLGVTLCIAIIAYKTMGSAIRQEEEATVERGPVPVARLP